LEVGENMTEEQKVTIDGKDYKVSDLSENAMKLITQITLVNNKKNSLMQEIDILDRASSAYSAMLKSDLETK
tara:strand:- start:293 stop:508 length:216 start_codon:yes stop_codon:yes gene_type:complete